MTQECKLCLLRDISGEDYANIEKYKLAIKETDRASEDLYEKRLAVCKSCSLLNRGTCNACGCYVEIRAFSHFACCPKKKW
ncbi:MAG: hypothetical protein HUJ71_09580 [Pseudobutyrivibrio sp.]|nr:hypothetical protein [Pseudobutyrivibrio sp.]